MKYAAIQQVFCMQSKQRPGTFIFPCKTIDFQHINKLTVQQIEVILLDPVHHIIHSLRAHDQTTQVLQILLDNYIIAT